MAYGGPVTVVWGCASRGLCLRHCCHETRAPSPVSRSLACLPSSHSPAASQRALVLLAVVGCFLMSTCLVVRRRDGARVPRGRRAPPEAQFSSFARFSAFPSRALKQLSMAEISSPYTVAGGPYCAWRVGDGGPRGRLGQAWASGRVLTRLPSFVVVPLPQSGPPRWPAAGARSRPTWLVG